MGDEEKLKALTSKEREEWKKAAVRLTGKFSQHFDSMLTHPSKDVNYLNATRPWRKTHFWKKEPCPSMQANMKGRGQAKKKMMTTRLLSATVIEVEEDDIPMEAAITPSTPCTYTPVIQAILLS